VDRGLWTAVVAHGGSGRVLLVRHAQGALNWDLPGGLVEPGESATAGALRHLREETGLTGEIVRLSGLYHEPEADTHHFAFFCRLRDPVALPRPRSSGISGCGYFALTELPRPLSDFTQRRIRDAQARSGEAALAVIGPRQWLG